MSGMLILMCGDVENDRFDLIEASRLAGIDPLEKYVVYTSLDKASMAAIKTEHKKGMHVIVFGEMMTRKDRRKAAGQFGKEKPDAIVMVVGVGADTRRFVYPIASESKRGSRFFFLG